MEEHDKITKKIILHLRKNKGMMNLGKLKEEIGKGNFEKVTFLLRKEILANWGTKDGKDMDANPIILSEPQAYYYLKNIKSEEFQERQIKTQEKQTNFHKWQVRISILLVLATFMLYLNGAKLAEINKQIAVPNSADVVVVAVDNFEIYKDSLVKGINELELLFVNVGRIPTARVSMSAIDKLFYFDFQRIENIDSGQSVRKRIKLSYKGNVSEIPLGFHNLNTYLVCDLCDPREIGEYEIKLCIYTNMTDYKTHCNWFK